MIIVFDGIDGAGKTTQIKKVKSWLNKHGLIFDAYREPGGTPLAERLRKIFLSESYDTQTQLFLLSCARYDLLKQIKQKNSPLVILDRFIDSTYAYQGISIDWAMIDKFIELSFASQADYTFLFLESFGKNENHMDKISMQNRDKIVQNFLKRASLNPEKYYIVPKDTEKNQFAFIEAKLKEVLCL